MLRYAGDKDRLENACNLGVMIFEKVLAEGTTVTDEEKRIANDFMDDYVELRKDE